MCHTPGVSDPAQPPAPPRDRDRDRDLDPIARHTRSRRELEDGIEQDFRRNLSYGEYLDLHRVLSAQHPQAVPPRHDELLFIIQHQTSELWLKLMLHELTSARELVRSDDLQPALKRIARVKHIQHTLTEQWSVLATLTPSEYALFRSFLATGSGFQSWQYRAVEFSLGNKNADMLRVFAHDPEVHAELDRLLHEPSLYDEVLRWLARQGHPVPAEVLDRDVTAPYESHEGVVDVFAASTRTRHGTGSSTTSPRTSGRGGQLPGMALPSPQDRGADHRLQAGDRRVLRGALPAPRARPDVLPRALRRAGPGAGRHAGGLPRG